MAFNCSSGFLSGIFAFGNQPDGGYAAGSDGLQKRRGRRILMDRNLNLKDVVVHFKVKEGTVKAVDHVNICFREGEITGLMGESGCGKSVLAMAILGLPSFLRQDRWRDLFGGQKSFESFPKRNEKIKRKKDRTDSPESCRLF